MPPRLRSRTNKPAARRVDLPTTVDAAPAKDKVRERLLAMILRNEAARKQAPR